MIGTHDHISSLSRGLVAINNIYANTPTAINRSS